MATFFSKVFYNMDECYCGCSLKVGAMIVTILELALSICLFILSTYLCSTMLYAEQFETFEEDNLWPNLYIIFVIFCVIFSIGIIFSAVGVYGIFKGNSQHVKLWLWHQMINILLTLLLVNVSAVFVGMYYDKASALFIGLYVFIYAVMKWICVSAVYSQFAVMGVDTMQGFSLPTVTLRKPLTSNGETHQPLDEEPEIPPEIHIDI